MQKRVYKIGLTGGIGCGKSEVRKRLEKLDIPTIDADNLSKQIAATDSRAVSAIKEEFGEDVYNKTGELQRGILADKVFGHPENLVKLNAILHPLVFEYVDRAILELGHTGEIFLVIEAALFYESGWDKQMDFMVVVTAPMEKRIQRLQHRDGVTIEKIHARMAHQLSVEKKAEQANYIIENNGSFAELEHAIHQMLAWLSKKLRI